MNPRLAQQLLRQVEHDYDVIADHFAHTRMSQWYEVGFLVEQYIRPGSLVLDLGCGNGRVADLVNEIKGRYIGMDVSAELVSIAKKRHPQNDFYVGTMLETGFDDNTFDVVLMVASFHHVPSEPLRVRALAEAKRIAKPDAIVIMTNWNLHQWKFFTLRTQFHLQKLVGKNHLDWNDVLIPWKDSKQHVLANRFYHSFTKREMRRIARKAGMRVVDNYYEKHGMHVQRATGQNLVTILEHP